MLLGEQPGDREDIEGRPFVGPDAVATVHPSSILREPDGGARHEAYGLFVRDLEVVGRRLRRAG